MTSVSVRPFRFPGDYERALQLWQSIGKGVHVGRSDSREEIEKKLARDPDLFLVAEADGELVGTVIGAYDGRRGFIYHLAVKADFRRLGLATRLMNEVEKRLRSHGCLRCHLFVLRENEGALRFYEKQGWDRMDYVYSYGKDLV